MRQKLLLLLAVLAGHTSVVAQNYNFLTNGLVAYFPFRGSAAEAFGKTPSGAVKDAVLTTDRFGNPNQAYHFNGTSSYITVPVAALPRNDRTISIWLRPEATIQNGPTLLAYGAGAGASFFMTIDSGCYGVPNPMLGIGAHGGNYNFAWNGRRLTPWIHWVVTIAQGRVTFFANGVQVASRAINFPPTSITDLFIGVAVYRPNANSPWLPYSDGCINYFKGSLDDLRLYNVALSAAQVSELYRLESTIPNPQPELVGPFDQQVQEGRRVVLEALVTSGEHPLTFEWFRNGAPIVSAENTNVLVLEDVRSRDQGTYHVRVSNAWGFATNSARLLVYPRELEVLDAVEVEFPTELGKSYFFPSLTNLLCREALAIWPLHSTNGIPGTGRMISTFFDASIEDPEGTKVIGQLLRLRDDGPVGAVDDGDAFSLKEDKAKPDWTKAIQMAGPEDQQVPVNGQAVFTVEVAPGSTLVPRFDWFRDGVAYPDSVNSNRLVIEDVRFGDAGRFHVRVTRGNEVVNSRVAQLTVHPFALRVFPAVGLRFPTEVGSTCCVESSSNGLNWQVEPTACGIVGTGERVTKFVSTRSGARYFRVVCATSANGD